MPTQLFRGLVGCPASPLPSRKWGFRLKCILTERVTGSWHRNGPRKFRPVEGSRPPFNASRGEALLGAVSGGMDPRRRSGPKKCTGCSPPPPCPGVPAEKGRIPITPLSLRLSGRHQAGFTVLSNFIPYAFSQQSDCFANIEERHAFLVAGCMDSSCRGSPCLS